jgi:anti-anti-sigma regulatory factor
MSQPVSVEVRDRLDHALVTVTGEVVGDAVAVVRRTVDDVCAMYSRMVLDVRGASFSDNLGIRELLRIRLQIADRNRSVRIVGMSEALRPRPARQVAPPGAQVPKVNGVLAVDEQPTDEVELIARVADRVRRRFPSADDEAVARVVADCYHQFDGNRIRDFIPILVEREVTDHFQALDRQTAG